MLLVTYATADEYLDALPGLLRGWRGDVYLEILPAEMKWVDACNHKPTLLRNAAKHHNGIIVYLDADATITTPFTEKDVAAALDGKTWGAHWHTSSEGAWCMSGTIFFDSRRRDVIEWLTQWRQACEAKPTRFLCDQANLTEIAQQWDHARLGPEWCWLEPQAVHKGTINEREPPDPVYVWHYQHSRKYANKKGGRGHD